MIILSKLADYGVIVATHMAAERDRQATAAAIAAATRGAAGGYRLAREPRAISLAEVVAAIDGDIGLTQCSVHVSGCARSNYCPTRPHWAVVNRAVGEALSAVSLDDMRNSQAFAAHLPMLSSPRKPERPRYSA